MYRRLIAICLTAAPIALAVAVFFVGLSAEDPSWWPASVGLAVLGGITIMIYGINIHSVPSHSGRTWASLPMVAAQVGAGIAGAWLVFLGEGFSIEAVASTGHALASAGAVLFMANLAMLFRQPGPPRPPKTPKDQRTSRQRVDRLAIPFTIVSGMVVVLGTLLGLLMSFWQPGFGRWDLVWAHVMLLGFFFAMASGTSYHMLPRWTGAPWRSIRLVQVHLYAFLISLPAMVIALGWDLDWLFLIGGPLMAISMLAWAGNVIPMALVMPVPVRLGIVLAMVFLTAGVGLGVMFAIDPASGPRLRGTHVAANVYGFGGLLISGFGYAFLPQLSGHEGLRWPRLAMAQLIVLVAGVGSGMIALGLRMYGEAGAEPVLVTCTIAAIGMLLFAAQVAGTFTARRNAPSEPIAGSVHAGSPS